MPDASVITDTFRGGVTERESERKRKREQV